MQMKIKGLKELENKLKQMEKNAKAINGKHNLSIKELFTDSFMRKYTKFGSIDAFFNASSYCINNVKDFEKIPEDEWSLYVAKNTSFTNWKDMLGKASVEWSAKKIGF